MTKTTPSVDHLAGVVVDPDKNLRVFIQDNILINHLKRDSHKIERSFDELCESDIKELSHLQSQAATLILAGMAKATKAGDRLRITCGQLLMNALNSFTAAVHVLRGGFVLQPPILLRSLLERLAVIIHLMMKPNDLADLNSGKLLSTKAVATASKAISGFGRLYGEFTNEFAHSSSIDLCLQPLSEYKALSEPLKVNLAYLRGSLWLFYVTVELTFHDVVPETRYWKRKGHGTLCYNPSTEEQEWLRKFLRVVKGDEK